ncbi:putative hydroxypyruvate reductase [Hartmannibacter diazotrophicus]|uniref:Putative hydroxypyruvate reductase n=1 Tax=Hartmannibacter diazotrophicus TaxID=1482074 RepID=A0A2C9D1E3_9HYPH|nr:glycerate kinase [Hartmannibacter diazotrophicus]SON54070.1 putative hydroxypyruvate reductase [Hartmannibacter diazotrophicus]
MAIDNPREFLKDLFKAAVDAADPDQIIARYLPERPKGRTIVVGAGKASAAMAQSFEKAWKAAGNGPLEGIVVTRYGYGHACEEIEIVEAAHPVPDAAGAAAAGRIMDLVSNLTPDDLVVALISGGGSSLLTMPPESLGGEAKREVNRVLLHSGASIHEMNCVRKHLSLIKGGRLAKAAHPAKVATLVISDIPGDDPALVASGPTIPDPATRKDALSIVERYGMALPQAAMDWLTSDAASAPHPNDPEFAGNSVAVIAAAQMSLEAAAAKARAAGLETHILSDSIEGEARDVGSMHAGIVRQMAQHGEPFARPCLLLSGGETTVTVRQKGRGGRNSEFLLSFAIGIAGVEGVTALAGDTDGIDGSEDNAGALCDGGTAEAIFQAGANPKELLARNDAWGAFDSVGSLLVTGPTRTNVNDFRAILVL